jgi:hypothetical protein
MLEDFFAWDPCRTTITLPRHLHLLITRHRVSQSTAPDRGLIDDMRPLRRTPTRQRRGQPHDARRSRACLTWGSSQLPRSLKNLRQNCLRLIVNVNGSLGLAAVPTTQTITPIFTKCWRCPGSAVEFRADVMRRQRRRLPVLRGALAPSSLELLPGGHRGKIDSGLLALESPPELTPGTGQRKLEFLKNHARNSAASRFLKDVAFSPTGKRPPLTTDSTKPALMKREPEVCWRIPRLRRAERGETSWQHGDKHLRWR